MTDNVEFQVAVPTDFLLDPPVSSSKSVQRRTLKEFLPTENTVYTPSSNSVIRFNVASNDSFLDGKRSYFKCQFTWQTFNNATDPCVFMLERGGYKSLFKNLEVYSQLNGTLLERIENANFYSALKETIMSSREDLENDLIEKSYMEDQLLDDPLKDARGWQRVPVVVVKTSGAGDGAAQLLSSGYVHEFTINTNQVNPGVVNFNTSNFVNPGDKVLIAGNVLNVTAVGGLTFNASGYLNGIGGADDGELYKVYVKRAPMHINAMTSYGVGNRLAAGQQAISQTVLFSLDLSILKLHLPLFLMKGGIQIRMELDSIQRSFYTVQNSLANADASLSYSIQYPRYMGLLVTPHGDVIEEFVSQFESPSGLLYYLPGVKSRKLTGQTNETSTTLQTNVGVRSGRRVYVAVVDSNLHESSTAKSRCNRSLSQYIKCNITGFQFKVGGVEYPLRRVDCTNEREWLKHLKMVSGSQNTLFSSEDVAFPGQLLITTDNINIGKCDQALIMAANFSRDDGEFGMLTGVDLSLVPLDVDITRALNYSAASASPTAAVAYNGVPTYYVFVEHDGYLRIGSDQISILN